LWAWGVYHLSADQRRRYQIRESWCGSLSVLTIFPFLRVHDVGTGFGVPPDFLDVEVVIQPDTRPGKSFGFQLRNDNNASARRNAGSARDAFANNVPVLIE
jgi:hypothetical protein